MPVEKETEKGRAGKTSTVYKCIMVKCNLDTEVEDKDIRIKVAYNTQDNYIPLCKENVHIYIHFLVKCMYLTNTCTKIYHIPLKYINYTMQKTNT